MTFSPDRRPPAAAIFDVDGTLVDSMSAWRVAPLQFLRDRGIACDASRMTALYDEKGFSKSCAFIAERWPICGTADSIEESIFRRMLPGYRHVFPAMPHAAEYLAFLHDAGISVCVLTANLRDLVTPALDRLGMTPHIAFLMACPEEGLRKTDPALFLRCADRLGVPAADCVMFEDMPFALDTARAAGLRTVAIEDPAYPERQPDLALHADRVIADYRELLERDVFAHDVERCG